MIERESKAEFVCEMAKALGSAGLFADPLSDWCKKAADRVVTDLHRRNCYIGRYLNATIVDPDL